MDPGEIASTIQSASINRHPSPSHDINPSTAASEKTPVEIHGSPPRYSRHASTPPSSPQIRPRERRQNFPPLPDLRFEQSYLASLPKDATWGLIAYITIKDQVLFPLIQGTLWQLIQVGWRHLNRGSSLVGQGAGARIRRWWWGVNNWEMPGEASSATDELRANAVKEVGS